MVVLAPVVIGSLDELRDYIQRQLCRRENLLLEQSPISEQVLIRNGQRCAYQYVVHGPRQMRLTAIYDLVRNEILFYDSTGARYQSAPLRYRLQRVA